MTKATWDNHVATFSKELMPHLIELASNSRRVLDPFAGVGKIHRLRDSLDIKTVGLEIQQSGVNMSPGMTILGDATDMPFEDESFDAAITSPTYGNRLADNYTIREVCQMCSGSGFETPENEGDRLACARCKGAGKNAWKRYTYPSSLPADDPLHPNNSGGMPWGKKYRDLHEKAWQELWRVLQPQTAENPHAGLFVLNIKNHYKTKYRQKDGVKTSVQELQRVAEWHIETLERIGFVVESRIDVKTPGMRHGQNGQVREDNERLYVLRKKAA